MSERPPEDDQPLQAPAAPPEGGDRPSEGDDPPRLPGVAAEEGESPDAPGEEGAVAAAEEREAAPPGPMEAGPPSGPVVVERFRRGGPPRGPLEEVGAEFWRTVVRWGAIIALAFFAMLTIGAWSVIQVTGEETAERIIKRSLVPLTEVDELLEAEYAAIVAAASESVDSETVLVISGYPLEIEIPTRELALLSREELRELLLNESAARIYDQGIIAFQQEPGGLDGDGILSARGVMRLSVGQLTRDNHQIAQIIGGLLVFVTAVLTLMVVFLSDGFRRIRNVGFALTIGAVPMTLAVVGARFAIRTAAGDADDPFNEAFLDVGAQLLWIPIRDFIIFGVLGLLVLALGIALELWEERRDPADRPGAPEEERQAGRRSV